MVFGIKVYVVYDLDLIFRIYCGRRLLIVVCWIFVLDVFYDICVKYFFLFFR